MSDARPGERVLTAEAVQLVNAALPEHRSVAVGSDFHSGLAAYGEVRVTYQDGATSPGNHSAIGTAYTDFGGAGRSDVYIDRGYAGVNVRYGVSVTLVMHELVHSLIGWSDHAPPGARSIMRPTIHAPTLNASAQPRTVLFPLDRSLLWRAHDPTAYAYWGTVEHLRADLGDLSFGVVHEHGALLPWAVGADPRGTARSLRGDLTYRRALVGITTDRDRSSVTGDATVRLNGEAMTGSADFTSLTEWSGAVGGGASTTWGDGDLSYSLSVGEEGLIVRTGGDEGTLTGSLSGRDASGVVGTLTRTDLVAAFGAERG